MGDENHIRTLGDYSKPIHEGYRNTIELPVGNNVVPLRSDTIQLVKNGCSFHRLRSEDPNQHLKNFLKLVDSLDIDKDLALYNNESWNNPSDFAKPVKVIALPQDVSSTSERHLIELENQVQHLMEAHLAPTQPTKVNKITTSCEICSGPHDTQYCMKDPKQAFVEYASSHTDEAGDPQCLTQTHCSINAITTHTKQQSASYNDGEKENKEEEDGPKNIHVNPPTPSDPSVTFIAEKVLKFNSFFESLGLVPLSSNTELVCTKEEDGDVMFIEIVSKDDNSRKEESEAGENEEDKRRGVEYVMRKILGFYKECLELRPEYLTGMDDEGEVT
nr:MAK10-like protein [Tanacetum cinerariifolium]